MIENMMAAIYRAFASVRDREEGQALVEYALVLALVSVAAAGTLAILGTSVDGILQQVVTAL